MEPQREGGGGGQISTNELVCYMHNPDTDNRVGRGGAGAMGSMGGK